MTASGAAPGLEVIQVAMVTDRGYLPFCAVAMLSAAEATAGAIHFHVLHLGDLDAEAQGRLQSSLGPRLDRHRVTFHSLDPERLRALPTKGPVLGGRISWARLLLPEALEGVPRVVYLDADVLVVDGLDALWSTPMEGRPIGAVSNVVQPALRQHVTSIGIDRHTDYFNAGVLLVDLDALRAEGFVPRALDLAEDERLLWFDQDVLNIVFRDRWLRLSPRWNVQNSFIDWQLWAEEALGASGVRAALSMPAVYHFEGPPFTKPWHYLCRHPRRAEYLRMLGRTAWAGRPLDERTNLTRVIRLLPRRHRVRVYLALRPDTPR